MKNILKRPSFWIALVCFGAAIALAVVSSIQKPGIPAIDRLERGMNKHDMKSIIPCFAPELQDAMRTQLSLYDGMDMDLFGDLLEDGSVNLLYGDAVMDEEGRGSVPVFLVYMKDGVCEEVDLEDMDLEEVDGKLYLVAY